jgi:lysozyme
MKNWFTAIGGLSLAATVFIGGTAMKSLDTDPIKNNSITVADSLVDTTALVWGIDLSHHQRNVDWDQIACENPHFIFFKATEGATHTDKMYHKYKFEAAERGIKVGSYHFFSYTTSGKDQALHFLKTAHIQKGDLPPVLDVEFKKEMASSAWISKNVQEWVRIIEDSIGVKPIIYCPCRMYNDHLESVLSDEYHLWIADYRKNPPGCNWTFWQKTDRHKLNGIAGNVDYNEFKGNILDLQEILID